MAGWCPLAARRPSSGNTVDRPDVPGDRQQTRPTPVPAFGLTAGTPQPRFRGRSIDDDARTGLQESRVIRGLMLPGEASMTAR